MANETCDRCGDSRELFRLAIEERQDTAFNGSRCTIYYRKVCRACIRAIKKFADELTWR